MNASLTYLIVDDFESIRRLVKQQCEQGGVKSIFEASDGKEAIEILQKHKVDVVICDWNMPNLSGIDVLKFVRSNAELEHVHFMFITAEAERDRIKEAIDEGVDEFLIKPFTPSMLRNKIAGMLRRPPRKKGLSALNQSDETNSNGEQLASAQPRNKDTKPTIVIVDDVPANIDVIRGMLMDNYKIKAATNGEKALKLVKTSNPDLILLDIMMPEMDGYQVCEAIKSDIETQHIPVIFLSTKNEVDDMTHGFEVGAVDYITKPVNPKILKARVNTHIRLKHANDDMAYQIQNLMEVAKLREDVERITRHDLKNPLSAILHKAENMIDAGYLHVEQKKDIETIRDAAYDILGMINRSLDLFKMETGSYALNAVAIDLVPITLKVVNESRINAHEIGVSIKFDAPSDCFIRGEELLCFAILGNLIKNAVEASPKEAKITVTFELDEHNANVLIHNDGVIPEAIRDTFFEKYVTTGKDNGTGLGTYSAKLMANVQQGDVTFVTEEKTGTTVRLTLPLDIQKD